MVIGFYIFLMIAGPLSLLASFGPNPQAAEQAFKVFCAIGAMILGLLLIATLSK